MNLFNLPIQTIKNKSVPKKNFYKYTNSKQQQLFVDIIDKIKWTNNISSETINLSANEIESIQIFEVTLKKKNKIETLLNIIEKAMPSHNIFIILFEDEMMLYTSKKHSSPTDENNAIVDWVFSTEWFKVKNNNYKLTLKESIDFIFKDFCFQISNRISESNTDLSLLIEKERALKDLDTKILKLEAQIRNGKQFNKKVELNIELQKLIIAKERISNKNY